jgi:uncharacterized protein with HEPN domain
MRRFTLLKQVEIIGEAVYKLSREVKAAYPEVNWNKIERTRHILVHDYFDVNWDILWDVIQLHIPTFKAQIHRVVSNRIDG